MGAIGMDLYLKTKRLRYRRGKVIPPFLTDAKSRN